MFNNCLKSLKIILISLVLVNTANAGNLTTQTQAKAVLASSCTVTAQNINFGTISPLPNGATYSNATLHLTCSKGASYNVILSSGSSSSNIDANGYGTTADLNQTFIRTSNPSFTTSYPGGAARIMNGTKGDNLVFNLYSDSAYTTPFIDSFYLTKIGTGADQTIIVYGKLPLNQFITPDNYTQNIIVVINY